MEGTARNMGGKLEEGLGRATGDIKSQVEGTAKQAVGAAQELMVKPARPPATRPRWCAGRRKLRAERFAKTSRFGRTRRSRSRLRSAGS